MDKINIALNRDKRCTYIIVEQNLEEILSRIVFIFDSKKEIQMFNGVGIIYKYKNG